MKSRLQLILPLLCASVIFMVQGSPVSLTALLANGLQQPMPQEVVNQTVNQAGNRLVNSETSIDYRHTLIDDSDFESLAASSDQPGAMNIREVKYLIMGIDTDSPQLYFFNTQRYSYHYDFAYEVLGYRGGLDEFNSATYFHDTRSNLAGSILAYDTYTSDLGELGLYSIQFWPVDPISPELTQLAYSMIAEQMTFALDKLWYYPASDIQLDIYNHHLDYFKVMQIPVIQSEALFAHVESAILNSGKGYGRLRVINPGDPLPSVSDVVIYTYVPNDLAHVAGIITDSPQTPLSHINLKAKQNGTPNAYIRDAVNDPQIASLIGRLVKYETSAEGISLTEATQQEVDTWLESVRPAPQTPEFDLTVTEPKLLSELGNADWIRFGAKAANVAELANALAPLERNYGHAMVPRGYGVPFAMYNDFMRVPRCQQLVQDEQGQWSSDGKYRALCDPQRLDKFKNTEHYSFDLSWFQQTSKIQIAAGSRDLTLMLDNADGLVLFIRDTTHDLWLLNPFLMSNSVLGASNSAEYRNLIIDYTNGSNMKSVAITGVTDFDLEVYLLAFKSAEAELTVTTTTAAIPSEYFVEKSYFQQIEAIMADESFQNSPNVRAQALKAFRKEITKGEVPIAMRDTLESMRLFWDPQGAPYQTNIRLRSSTNNEDLQGFNGAGLYESNTHKPDEGDLAESVKKVWASLWTHRAFEERRFYRIDHFKTYMGVLVHESYGDEQANGVAVTKNIYDENWEGYYVNVQHGEISVTNPEPILTSQGLTSSVPDEFLLAHLLAGNDPYNPDDWWWTQQYIRHSNVETVYDRPVQGDTVLTAEETVALREAMQAIQGHFKPIYRGGDDFAMDIEFKITATEGGTRGHLEVKQARPWID
ncbi:PEP/pyruvate-binding domain-containing protein [uncultured Shewanella sp.]|uniref:PEP/pyruvate-binding domain-containing protein n=1 Tax=uncultured Shewanella sp. TaxID=173975 RepID=UPI002605F8DB|nr:PEP/pyruvate-binding domain-containing protein [uncultured Shewanella sp.]